MKSAVSSASTPRALGFYQPAEWSRHKACWLAWPNDASLWQEDLADCQREFTALCHAIGASETLNILVPDDAAKRDATNALAGLPVHFHAIPFGDIWLRDTAPIFLRNQAGVNATVRFGFNGWGGKFNLPHDREVSSRIAQAHTARPFVFTSVLEGGSVEVDGQGTCLTTRQCLLNPNRNPGIDLPHAEELLRESLGVQKILWLGDGLLNDHTDGHIDTLARFSRPGTVLCMTATEIEDPNRAVLKQIASDLQTFTDAQGRKLEVIQIPSPGRILDDEGEVMPASYMNFYVSNDSVIVPIYGSDQDAVAVEQIRKCFPGRRTLGLSAKVILRGGGAFHCITQQEPERS